MAVDTGIASGHLDLLERLRAFLTSNSALVAAGQQWTVLRDATPSFGGTGYQRELQFRAPGLSGSDQFFCSIQPYESTTSDYYNWGMRGGVGFLSTVAAGSQPGVSPMQHLNLWNAPIPFWFIANGRRVIIVAKISTTYQMAYLGAYLPYATPSQVPYPMYIGGTTGYANRRWSDTTVQHRAFWDGHLLSSALYHVDGTWLRPANWTDSQDSLVNPDGGAYVVNIAPYQGPGETRNVGMSIRDNVDGSAPLFPIQFTMRQPNNVLGELDGIYFTPGFNNASENIVQAGGLDHLVVQDTFRTNRANYCAVRLS